MKIVVLIARILLGLVFVVFGLNIFLHFIPAPMPTGLAGQFSMALYQSKYLLFVGAFQVVGGALLLIGRFVPLGLTLLGPVLVNILLFHILFGAPGLHMALICTVLWLMVFYSERSAFAGIFRPR